jgi:hypothetical protein
MSMPLEKPEGLNWNAASVELPDIPMLPAGQDALSATISAVLPTLAVPLAANVATLQAKENMFSGKLGAAQAAYQNSDDSGSQSVGQVVGMLGQLGQQAGQMGQQAGAPMQALGGQTGMFGSLMQQAMQAAQGGGGAGGTGGGQSSGGSGVPGGAAPTGGAGQGPSGGVGLQQPRDDAVDIKQVEASQPQESARDEREPLQRADDRGMAGGASGPEDSRPGAGPVPVTPPERHDGDDDLARRM